MAREMTVMEKDEVCNSTSYITMGHQSTNTYPLLVHKKCQEGTSY